MKVWRMDDDASNFKRLILKGDISGEEFIRSFDGSSKRDTWTSPELEFEPEDNNKPLGDLIHLLSGFFVVNERVSRLMEEYFGESIELLPLDLDEGLYIVNVLDVGKYVDYEKSNIKYFPNSNNILRIKKFAFVETLVSKRLMFKDDGFPVTDIYVTDEAKKIIENWNILGVSFIELWDSAN